MPTVIFVFPNKLNSIFIHKFYQYQRVNAKSSISTFLCQVLDRFIHAYRRSSSQSSTDLLRRLNCFCTLLAELPQQFVDSEGIIGRYDIYQGCANRCLEQFYKAALPSSGYGTDWLDYRRKPKELEGGIEVC